MSIIQGDMRLTKPVYFAFALFILPAICRGQSTSSRQAELAHHESLAKQYLSERKPAQAIPELQAVVALDPQNLDARANLGVLFFFQGEFNRG